MKISNIFLLSLFIVCGFNLPKASAKSERLPTDYELSQISREISQKLPSWKKIRSRGRMPSSNLTSQGIKNFRNAWSKENLALKNFLGSWVGWEDRISIYPSSNSNQVCVISRDLDQPINLEIGSIKNNMILVEAKNYAILNQGGYLWIASVSKGKASYETYPYSNAKELLPLEQDFNYPQAQVYRVSNLFTSAGCTTFLPKNIQTTSVSFSNSTQSFKIQGDAFLNQKIWRNAITSYTQGIKLSPRYSALYYNRGLAYLNNGNKNAALADFQEAAELFLQQRKWGDRQDAISMIAQIESTVVNDYKLTKSSRLTLRGIGPVRVGMTIEEASKASGISSWNLIYGGGREGICKYYKPQININDVSFMVINGHIARIDINNKYIQTIRGIKIGDTEKAVKSLYPGQITISPHPYGRPNGNSHYLTFIPKDAADQNYRYIFETSGDRVQRFRSGQLPEVEYIEGCL
jgi:tetratricopeptide (TPR) repeat protein